MLFWENLKNKYISDTYSDSLIIVIGMVATFIWSNMSTMLGDKIWLFNLAHGENEKLSNVASFCHILIFSPFLVLFIEKDI